MLSNRSMPASVVIPELAVRDVTAASAWLSTAFGMTPRLVIGNHRIQMTVHSGGGPGEFVLVGSALAAPASVMIRIEDAEAHCSRARSAGATILSEPTSYPYGERQYTAVDPDDHRWTFSQTLADVDPTTWGGVIP